eukprot:g7412.t1
MLMLAPLSPAVGRVVGTNVVLYGANGFGSRLAGAISQDSSTADLGQRCSPVLGVEGLKEICDGAETMYLLSALDLPPLPTDSDLETFTTDVSRVVDCCIECGLESLVFTSSVGAVPTQAQDERQGREPAGRARADAAEENLSCVTREKDARAHAIARAQAIVLEASGSAGPSSRLHTCALCPAPVVYGYSAPEQDSLLHKTLSWVGWGLNRVAVGPKNDSGTLTSGTVHVDNLVEAHLCAGASLKTVSQDSAMRNSDVQVKEAQDAGAATEGAYEAGAERTSVRGGSTGASPACSGQAYFVGDGQPCRPQAFLDGVLDGLGFATMKVVRVPTRVALFAAWVAELVFKAGVTRTPVLTRSYVWALTENRPFTNARAQRDLGYVPRVDPASASKDIVESLKRAGWSKHRVSRPGLWYWICNPGGIWLTTLAAFGGPCPPFMAPLARGAEHVGLSLFHQASTVRAVCVAVYVIHVLEAVYAFRVARQAGHRDTAPGWMAQTFLLGFPSISLVNQLLPKREEGLDRGDGDGTKSVV